jgi:hypothetical protein
VKETKAMAERKPGETPADAVEDRAAQQHDLAYDEAGGEPEPGLYPADDIENRKGENTPDVAHPAVDWNKRVQPERPDETSRDGPVASPDIETERT